MYLAMDDSSKLKEAAILELVRSLFPEYQKCSTEKESACGCILIGIVAGGEETRLVPLDKAACKKSIGRLPQPEANFWRKRIVWDAETRTDDGLESQENGGRSRPR